MAKKEVPASARSGKPARKSASKSAKSASRGSGRRRPATRKAGDGPSVRELGLQKPEPLEIDPPRSRQKVSLTVAAGVAPDVQTIIYVHGIGNKPPAAVLKCQWDHALFGADLGDRSRMAYWVNRDFYPVPSSDTCQSGDTIRVDDDDISTRAIMSLATAGPGDELDAIDAEIESMAETEAQRQWLRKMSRQMIAHGSASSATIGAADVSARILPLPEFLRKLITRKITRAFMRDVNDFFFNAERRRVMEESLLERLNAGGGPFVVIAHSQGSMIAYNVLRRLHRTDCDVRLLVTIGSPLGIQETQDVLDDWGALEVPECVSRWVNVADRLDPVAADATLSDEYAPVGGVAIEDFNRIGLNPDSPRSPHSATGYLRTSEVAGAVRQTVGHAFGQPVGKFVIARDLVGDIENGLRDERHMTLIQLASGTAAGIETLDTVREKITAALTDLVRSSGDDPVEDARIDPLKRYVAAKLTRREIESLRTLFKDLQIERVWRDAHKRALIHQSTHTIQAHPANIGYGATGRDICWAVLDTGIRADHPHFAELGNICAQFDCTTGRKVTEVKGRESETLDRNGHGTHVAGIIAGRMKIPLRPGEAPVLLTGMAPETKLFGFKVLDDDGNGQDSWIIKALDHIADINESAGKLVIQGINLSLGGTFDPSVYGCGHTPMCQELRRLWNQGVIVTLAAGNEGYTRVLSGGEEIAVNMDLSIGDPANLDEAIAVGSIHKSNPFTYGVSYFSSRGPTADGRRKPDLVAPGEQILSAYNQWKKKKAPTAEDLYVELSGTSMAAPHVSGILAGFLSMRREFIGYPAKVKQMLLGSCTDLERDPYIQGHGMPNLVRMMIES
jgi:subtilisin family serine protease